MFESIGLPELLVILVIALLLFGANRLPELAKSLGSSINEFKRGLHEDAAKTDAAGKPLTKP